MPALLPVLAAVIASLLTALVQIYLGRRTKRGTVATSEASEVWAARRELTNELIAELKRTQEVNKEQFKENDLLRGEASRVRIELVAVREEAEPTRNAMESLRTETGTMKIRMVDLERQLDDCRHWLAQAVDTAKEAKSE